MASENTIKRILHLYDTVSDVAEMQVQFASKNLMPCKMHLIWFQITQMDHIT